MGERCGEGREMFTAWNCPSWNVPMSENGICRHVTLGEEEAIIVGRG